MATTKADLYGGMLAVMRRRLAGAQRQARVTGNGERVRRYEAEVARLEALARGEREAQAMERYHDFWTMADAGQW